MKNDNWIVDCKNGTVKHTKSKLTLTVDNGEFVNIENMPSTLRPSELRLLLEDALLAYKDHAKKTPGLAPSPIPNHKPKRSLLSLKKKSSL